MADEVTERPANWAGRLELARLDALDLVENPDRAKQRAVVRRALARIGIRGDVLRMPKPKPKPGKTLQLKMLPYFKGKTPLRKMLNHE